MAKMGNHLIIPDAVPLHFRLPKFRNTLVANGELCFWDHVKLFKEAG